MTDIERRKRAIKDLHKCDRRHLGTVRVRETLAAATLWEGFVEIFFLINHPEAKKLTLGSTKLVPQKPTVLFFSAYRITLRRRAGFLSFEASYTF